MRKRLYKISRAIESKFLLEDQVLAIFLINRDLKDSIYKEWNRYLKASEKYCTGNEGVFYMKLQEELPGSLSPETPQFNYSNFGSMCESLRRSSLCLDGVSPKRNLLVVDNSKNPYLNIQKNAAQELWN